MSCLRSLKVTLPPVIASLWSRLNQLLMESRLHFRILRRDSVVLLRAHPLNTFLLVPVNAPECTRSRSGIWFRANGTRALQTAFAKRRHIGHIGRMMIPPKCQFFILLYGYDSFPTQKKHRFVCLAKRQLSFNPFCVRSRSFLRWMYCCLLYSIEDYKAFRFIIIINDLTVPFVTPYVVITKSFD